MQKRAAKSKYSTCAVLYILDYIPPWACCVCELPRKEQDRQQFITDFDVFNGSRVKGGKT